MKGSVREGCSFSFLSRITIKHSGYELKRFSSSNVKWFIKNRTVGRNLQVKDTLFYFLWFRSKIQWILLPSRYVLLCLPLKTWSVKKKRNCIDRKREFSFFLAFFRFGNLFGFRLHCAICFSLFRINRQ